jgi:hypothetical protein
VAFAFEKEGSFRNTSTERGESLFAIFKRFVSERKRKRKRERKRERERERRKREREKERREREKEREKEKEKQRNRERDGVLYYRILKNYTDRRMKPAIPEVFIRREYENKLNGLLGEPRDKERNITNLFCNNHVCS